MKTFNTKEFYNEFHNLTLTDKEHFISIEWIGGAEYRARLRTGERVIFDLSKIVKVGGFTKFTDTRQLCIRFTEGKSMSLGLTFDFSPSGGIWIIGHTQIGGIKLPCVRVDSVKDFMSIILNDCKMKRQLEENDRARIITTIRFYDDTFNPKDYEWD